MTDHVKQGTEARLRGIGLVSRSPRWPNLARHFPTGRAFVGDKTGFSSERRNPHDLLHGGAAAWAGDYTFSSPNVRHNSLNIRTLSLRVNAPPIRWFRFARGNVRAYDLHFGSGSTV